MKILVCDRCGHQERISPIRGNEFDYRGFQTLIKPLQSGGIADLCGTCFAEAERLYRIANAPDLRRFEEWLTSKPAQAG